MLNPLRDPTAALQFAVWFVQEDLDALSRKELRAVAIRVQAFIARAEIDFRKNREVADEDVPWAPRHDRTTLRAMQMDLRPMLEAFAIPRTGRDGRRRRRFAVVGLSPPKFWLVEYEDDHKWRIARLPDGPPRARFLDEAANVLVQVVPQRLFMCKDAPRCTRLFVKVTKKEFCSTRCQSRYYMRERRQREREQDAKQRGKATRTR
jgi:hypothetical protein